MAAGCGLLTAALQAAVVAAAASAALLLVGVGVLVVLHACTVAKAVSAAAAPATRGLSPRELSRMPSYTASGGGGGGDDVDCAVCLEGFRAGEVCRLLPACGHSFHAQCVDSWLLMMPVCPMCRNGVGGGGGGGPTLQQGRSSSASASSE